MRPLAFDTLPFPGSEGGEGTGAREYGGKRFALCGFLAKNLPGHRYFSSADIPRGRLNDTFWYGADDDLDVLYSAAIAVFELGYLCPHEFERRQQGKMAA